MSDDLPQATPVKQVFISHASEADGDFARRLAGDLRRLGVRVWIAPDSILPSEDWPDAIDRGLSESSHTVIVLTPAALESQWVKKETSAAIILERQGRMHVIPLEVKPCKVPPLLSSYQMISFLQGYGAGLSRLCNALGLSTTPEVPPKHAKPKWQRNPLLLVPVALVALALVIGIGVLGLGDRFWSPTLTPSPATTPVLLTVAAPTPTPPRLQPPPNASLNDTWTRPADDMVMVYVPGGTFQMGSTDAEMDAALKQCEEDIGTGMCDRRKFVAEFPEHSVTLDGFWIDRTEVTNSQYARCVTDGPCDLPSILVSTTHDSYYGNSQFDDYPVIYVSWNDAATYCRWAGRRLPTEAEWEYAARGSDGHIYPWGNDAPDDALLNYNNNVGDTAEVGSYPDGASWVGAMDMAGNVWEWVNDWYEYDYYFSSPALNPKGPETGEGKVLRGGGWSIYGSSVRAANRSTTDTPDGRYAHVGFRCVVDSGD